MADFCHDFDPGGLGCPQHLGQCPDNCAGDFTWAFDHYSNMPIGHHVFLGICEGHGAAAYLENRDGKLKFVEYTIGHNQEVSFNERP